MSERFLLVGVAALCLLVMGMSNYTVHMTTQVTAQCLATVRSIQNDLNALLEETTGAE